MSAEKEVKTDLNKENSMEAEHSDEDDVLTLEQDSQFPRLNKTVRRQYLQHLERTLKENYCTWKEKEKSSQPKWKAPQHPNNLEDPLSAPFIQRTAKLLEDKAIQACMVAQFYQRAMVQIIANVRHCTQDQRLVKQLARALDNNGQEQAADASSGEGEDGRSLKMEIDEDSINHDREKSNDSVDNEMARMFNEDCGELEEIFGLKDVAEAHDPLISRILQEIKQSNLSKRPSSANRGEKIHPANRSLIKASASRPPDARRAPPQPRHGAGQHVQIPARPTDLSKSLWPCELYRQKRKLSHCLSCLVDEDYRWLDVFKWQFEFLFGEDSDDEFAHCSPTIELDEVLIGSCVRRITPWIVRHLMPPMRDGLISNRFLFKKLAKQLSRAIILVNQYPDESFIKYAIENFFCVRNRVHSIEDLIEMPNIFYGT